MTAKPADEPEDLLAGLRTGAWLDAQRFAPLRYALPPLIPEGLVLLAGAPKIGKSWLSLGIGLGCAYDGGQALGLKAERRDVFCLALEDGDRRMQDRCRKLLADEPIPDTFGYMTRVRGPLILDTIGAWLARDRDDPPLVILDTLGKVRPPARAGETTYDRDYRIGSALKYLADEHDHMTLLVNHHDRKAQSEDFVDTISGTHGLAGAADAILVVTRDRYERDGLLKVTGRDVIENEYAVVFDAGYWTLAGADPTQAARKAAIERQTRGLGERQAAIIEYVCASPSPVRPEDVAKALDLPIARARTYLARAADDKRLDRVSRGWYTAPPAATP